METADRAFVVDTLAPKRDIGAMVEYALGGRATVNVGVRNDAYGTGLQADFSEAWTAAGGTIGQSVEWNPDAATFDTEAQTLVEGSPDAWLIVDFPETFAKVGPALVRTGSWDPTKTFVTDGLRDASLPGSAGDQATEGLLGTSPTTASNPAAKGFDADLVFLACEIDGENLTFQAISRTGKVIDSGIIKRRMETTKAV